MSRPVVIADAVVTALNAQFSAQFTAVRRALPSRTIEELADLCVTVSPRAVEWTPDTRGSARKIATIDIGVQQKVGADLDADVAGLADLAEDILEHMWGRPLSGVSGVSFLGGANDPIVNVEHLQQNRVFTGLVTLRYRC